MKIEELSMKGAFHPNNNEDALVSTEIGDNKLVMAVMDGCSMGKESHFASVLIAKLIRKTSFQLNYLEFMEPLIHPPQKTLYKLLQHLFQDLKTIKRMLGLETQELLSTLLLAVLDKEQKEAAVIVSGDGLIRYNDQTIIFDQDNQPDYLGYHLDQAFEDWYQQHPQFLYLEKVDQLALATDGICTFRQMDLEVYPTLSEAAIIHYLFGLSSCLDKEVSIKNKIIHLQEQYGLHPSDDLSIILAANEKDPPE